MLDGKFVEESRMLLAAEVLSGRTRVLDVLAFNDIQRQQGRRRQPDRARGAHRRPVRLQPARRRPDRGDADRFDGVRVVGRRADSASALSAMSLVPVCPHTLSNRPIVVSSECRDRGPHPQARRCARAFRQPFALRAAGRRPHPRAALPAHHPPAASGRAQLLPHAAREAALERDALDGREPIRKRPCCAR